MLLIVLIVILIIIIYYIIYIVNKDNFTGDWVYNNQIIFISHNRFTNLCKVKFRDNTEVSGYIKDNRIFIHSDKSKKNIRKESSRMWWLPED